MEPFQIFMLVALVLLACSVVSLQVQIKLLADLVQAQTDVVRSSSDGYQLLVRECIDLLRKHGVLVNGTDDVEKNP